MLILFYSHGYYVHNFAKLIFLHWHNFSVSNVVLIVGSTSASDCKQCPNDVSGLEGMSRVDENSSCSCKECISFLTHFMLLIFLY